jgi:hypothetical protein
MAHDTRDRREALPERADAGHDTPPRDGVSSASDMRAAAMLLTLLLLTAAASLSALAVTLDAPDALLPCWNRLLAAHPLPGGAIVVRGADVGGSDTLSLSLGPDGPAPGARPVERITLAAVARLWEPPRPVTLADARSGRVRVMPLDTVALPDTALAVDGAFPGEPGYALEGTVSLAASAPSAELAAWLDAIPPAPAAAPPPPLVWIGAVGDVMPARGVDAALAAGGGTQRVFGDTLPVLGSADLLIGNLEAAATAAGTRAAKTYTFRFDRRALLPLARAGFGYFSIANNHAFDFGARGFLDTLEALREAGIATSGAGRTAAEAAIPFTTRRGGTEIRVLSFGGYPVDRMGFDGRKSARAAGGAPGTLWLDRDGIDAAAAGFSPGSFDVAVVHAGEEWSRAPSAELRRIYRGLVDAGADLVIGSHPHVLQGLEAYQGSLIAYSLGNFLFPGMEGTPGGEDSVILRVGILAGRVVAVQAVPVRLTGTTVRRAGGCGAAAELSALSVRLAGGR